MSTSEKQLAANRQNAQLSTGPKTNEGKAVASQNAAKHGLYSDKVIVNSKYLKEDQAEYDNLLFNLRADLNPIGMFQDILVQKIANCLWRLRRAMNAETAHISDRINRIDSDQLSYYAYVTLLFRACSDRATQTADKKDDYKIDADAMLISRQIPDDTLGALLDRYESRLDRQLARNLRLLRTLQGKSAYK